MTTLRSFLRDERGQSPYIIVASLMMFVLVSAGITAGLIGSAQVTASIQFTAQAQDATTAAVHDAARLGFDSVAALPATAEFTVTAGEHTARGIRTVQVNPDTRTARVTAYTGAFTGSGFADPDECDTVPDGCSIATVMVTGAGLEVGP